MWRWFGSFEEWFRVVNVEWRYVVGVVFEEVVGCFWEFVNVGEEEGW